ncbi:MAG: hypothetical protein IH607_04560, partial [Firmicutes bacterium]|nr:hypothetical protein [Bacillota bacterium]
VTRNGNAVKHLKDEVAYTITYVKIQTIRFPSMQYDIQPLPPVFEPIEVPQMILQPVFENVFQHAQHTLSSGESLKLQMTYKTIGEDSVCIVIENNGSISDERIGELQKNLEHVDRLTELTGLLNIHKRLKLFFGDMAGLSVGKSALGGLCVRICVMR